MEEYHGFFRSHTVAPANTGAAGAAGAGAGGGTTNPVAAGTVCACTGGSMTAIALSIAPSTIRSLISSRTSSWEDTTGNCRVGKRGGEEAQQPPTPTRSYYTMPLKQTEYSATVERGVRDAMINPQKHRHTNTTPCCRDDATSALSPTESIMHTQHNTMH